MVYSLPNRLIEVQVTFSKDGDHKIAVKGGGYYPDGDLSSRFVARVHKGKIGKVKATVKTTNGMLASADAAYTGQASEFAEAVGTALGTVNAMAVGGGKPPSDPAYCNRELTLNHSVPLIRFKESLHSFNVMGGSAACANITMTIDRLGDFSSEDSGSGPRNDGLWYRIELPYTITATLGDGVTTTAIVMLPDESPAYFVEMDSGVFANSDNKMAFINGMLTSYEKSNDSEIISLFKLPAGIISSYATAIGNVFKNFNTADKHEINDEITRINQQLLLKKIEACKLAIAEKQSEETIATLCGLQPLP